ncbi:MAG TPA: GspE/PulE family protein [Rhodanobacteraceae bacterium]
MAINPQPISLLGRHGRLELDETLAALVVDGHLTGEEAKRVRLGTAGGQDQTALHPLVVIGKARLDNRRDPDGRPLSIEVLTEWLARKASLDYLKIDPMKIDVAAVTRVVGRAYAQNHAILPVAVDRDTTTFATCEPFATAWADDLSRMLSREIRLVVSNPQEINRYLAEFYGVQRSIRLAQDAKGDTLPSSVGFNFEQLLQLGESGEVGADDRHVVHIVDWLLQYAFEQRASDIHLEPRRETGNMRFRIDGVMHKVFELPMPVMTAVTSRIKILSRLDVAEKRRPQDGRIKTRAKSGREVELRISTMPTAFGEKVVMRIFDPDIVAKDFAQLGFTEAEAATWRHMVERPNGIVLVTGPTGSGKTTTLYSTLKHLARPEVNVCTVEDPIEMVSPELNQMQVQPGIDLTFATGVRTLLRQDPDIIMVGEIRDLETAQMAIQAALTGHLVLSTLHTNDAPSALTRLLDLGAPHYLISSTLAGIVAQRLLRTLCPHCKIAAEQDPQTWDALTHGWDVPLPELVYAPVGCLECRHTGFLGRTGVYEMLPMTPTLRVHITAELDLATFTRAARTEGMRSLRASAAVQVARGLTTTAEALAVLPPTD